MSKTRFPYDRSAAFTVLLEDEQFAKSVDDGGNTVTRFLEAWYLDPSLDMYEFSKRWLAQERSTA